MKKYFCCSDTHSFYNEWMTALANEGFDETNPDHVIILCGDLFDRGEQSIECYEFAKRMLSDNRFIYVRGNHEDLIIRCLHDLTTGVRIGSHHLSNGTISTIAQLLGCNIFDFLNNHYAILRLYDLRDELTSFIETNSVDYFELGDKVFVHGWVPITTSEDGFETVSENWRKEDWEHARWECCFDAWRCKLTPPDKTVVCGHCHTSAGWAEFRGTPEWDEGSNFTPFIDDGIIAIDGCTAYTGNVNIVVFDENGNLVE